MGSRISNFITRHFMLVFGGFFAGSGLMFIVVGIIVHSSHSEFKETALPAVAVITDIEVTRRRGGNGQSSTDHDVHVEYTVDGVVYNGELSYYTSDMRVGQKLDILYNPANPSEIVSVFGSWMFILVFGGIGTVSAVFGGVIVYFALRRLRKIKELITTGLPVIASVTGVSKNTSLSINNRHPYRVTCEWTDPASGIRHEFVSGNIMELPGSLMPQDGVQSPVTVYINPANPAEYHVSEDFQGEMP